MNTKTKKGFTLTELIIVVVIIGILAAVLIPTLTACVKKAKISNDKQLVRNLNLALSTDSLANHDGEKHKNMQEALDAAEIAGYIVDRINATKADNEILWDSENDVFCYLNAGEIEYIPSSVSTGQELNATDLTKSVKLFQIIKLAGNENLRDDDKYPFSVYAAPGSQVVAITTNKGFDAGKEAYTAISYDRTAAGEDSNGHKVIIRTNEGSLTINASSDTVNHYGYVEVLDVQAIDAIHSYHENGTAGFARLKQGHFVVESEGIINVLYATGLKTEVVVDNNNGIIGKAYATVTETANIYNEVAQEGQSGNVTLEKYDSVITEAVVTAMDSESIVEVLASEGTSNIKTTIKTAVESSSFRGEGTSANPYLISNINELEILRQRVADGNEYTGKHFKLTRNIDMSSISNWLGIGTGGGSSQYCFEGVFDGDGKTISGLRANNSTSEGFGLFSYIRNATIKNFTISDAQIVSTKKIGIAVGMAFGNVDIENITIESNCSITGTSTIGGVVGNIALSNSADDYKKANCYTFTVKNLTNKATVTCSATSQSVTQRVGGVIGNIQKIDDSPATLLDIELKNLTNEGAVSCDYSGGIVGGVQSGFNLSRASYSDDFKYRVMKFVECTNKYAGVKGEIIGYLDGAPKNFEFKKCKVSSDLNNYVNAWNGKLIYCRTENGQYTPSFMFVDNGTIKHTYLIVMNLSSGTTYYNDISNTLTTSRTQFEAYLNNHVQANNEAKTSYGTINQSFENPHGLIHPFETTEGLFSESTPGGNPNDLAYTPYVVIEVEND